MFCDSTLALKSNWTPIWSCPKNTPLIKFLYPEIPMGKLDKNDNCILYMTCRNEVVLWCEYWICVKESRMKFYRMWANFIGTGTARRNWYLAVPPGCMPWNYSNLTRINNKLLWCEHWICVLFNFLWSSIEGGHILIQNANSFFEYILVFISFWILGKNIVK